MNSCVPLPVARLITHALPNRSPPPLRSLVKAASSKSFSSFFTVVEARSALLSNKKVSGSKSDWTASGRAALFSVPNRSGRDRTQSFIFASCTLQLNFSPWKSSQLNKTYAFVARWIPICSTTSLDFRKPAVSATIIGSPPMSSESSMISRVVPGIGVTIAASR